MSKKSVLFICLGNICRSPMAEAVFSDLVSKKNLTDKWTIDSAAVIDYHVGKGPEPRTLKVLQNHGITNYNHTVRQVTVEDFRKFDYIFAMDEDNISDLNRVKPKNVKAKVELLGTYDPDGELEIPDPFYEKGTAMFEQVYVQCRRACEGFLKSLGHS